MGIFLGLLPKDLILLGLPRVRYFPRLFFLSLPDFLGFLGFLLFRLPLLLDALLGRSYLGLRRFLNPGLLGRRLALDLFKILLQIRIHQNRFWVYNGGDSSGI